MLITTITNIDAFNVEIIASNKIAEKAYFFSLFNLYFSTKNNIHTKIAKPKISGFNVNFNFIESGTMFKKDITISMFFVLYPYSLNKK